MVFQRISPRRRPAPYAALILVALSTGCSGDGADDADGLPEQLSGWELFSDIAEQTPAEGVVPYEVKSPLFTDNALKHRFMRLPPGEAATYDDDGAWGFPEGTVLVKTFAFPVDPWYQVGDPRLVLALLLSTIGFAVASLRGRG